MGGLCQVPKIMYTISYTFNITLLIIIVTGYWKANHNVTQSKVHFIVPPNSHTHAIPMHSVFARLSWLVCFSRRLSADPVKSRLSQWCQ